MNVLDHLLCDLCRRHLGQNQPVQVMHSVLHADRPQVHVQIGPETLVRPVGFAHHAQAFVLGAPLAGQVAVTAHQQPTPGARVGNKKPTQKTYPKNPKKPTKNVFFVGFLKFLIFYENNTNFSL
jgi:hypothetical protein